MIDRTTSPTRSISLIWWVFTGIFFTALSLYHCSLYYPFIADDALISLRYAERFLQGDGLTWTAGESVEGYSNLSWILGVATLGSLGIDLITATRILGILSIVFTMWALAYISLSQNRTQSFLPWIGGVTILCASPPIAVWAIGGLEQNLFLAALTWYFVGGLKLLDDPDSVSKKLISISSFAGALLCLTRPDGPIFIALWSLYFFVIILLNKDQVVRSRLKHGAPLLLWPLCTYLAHTLFRVLYYGDWVPNTAYLKTNISSQTMTWGGEYWYEIAFVMGPLGLSALLAFFSPQRKKVGLLWLCILTWIGYTWVIGGDIFPGHRHAVVVCGLLSILTLIGLKSITHRPLQMVCLVVIAWTSLVSFQTSQSTAAYVNAKLERWEWDGKIIGEWIGASFRPSNPLLAVTAAGTLPYFSKLRSLDMQGLNDRHIAQKPAQPKYLLAHNHGDGAYVLSRKPDLLAFRVFGLGPPAFVSGDQMKKSREFIMRYRLRDFEGQYPHYVKSRMYVRLDGTVGVHNITSDEVYLPAYLFRDMITLPSPDLSQPIQPPSTFASELSPPSQRHPAVDMVVKWPIEEMVHFTNFPLPSGLWSVEVDPPLPILIKTFGKRGQKSADIGIQVLDSYEALSAPAPKTYKRYHEVLVKGIKLKRIGEAEYPQFVASPEGLQKAQIIEEQALHNPMMITLDDFEQSKSSPPSLWSGQWRETNGKMNHNGLKYLTLGSVPQQNIVRQFGGKTLVNTYHKHFGDQIMMKAWSPRITIPPHSVLSFKVGGGSTQRKVGVRLWVDEIAIGTWSGRDTESLRQYHIDLRIFTGRNLQVELLDQSQQSWGHLLFDDLWLSNHIRMSKARVSDEQNTPLSPHP